MKRTMTFAALGLLLLAGCGPVVIPVPVGSVEIVVPTATPVATVVAAAAEATPAVEPARVDVTTTVTTTVVTSTVVTEAVPIAPVNATLPEPTATPEAQPTAAVVIVEAAATTQTVAPADAITPTAAGAPAAPPTALRFLTNADLCLWAEAGTPEFDGTTVSYSCTRSGLDAGVVVGPMTAVDLNATFVNLTRGIVGLDPQGQPVESRLVLTTTVAAVELADGTLCYNAGTGASPAFDGQRVNFNCTDAAYVLVGPLVQQENGLWLAERGTVTGSPAALTLEASEMLPISALTLQSDFVLLGGRDNGAPLTARAGQVIVVSLPADPADGATWQGLPAEAGGALDVNVLAPLGQAVFTPESAATGAPGVQALSYTAAATGTTTLALVYSRPGEPVAEDAPRWTSAITVE